LLQIEDRAAASPRSDDPQAEMNRKMMSFMPIMLTFMFYAMPAGLMLYFAVQRHLRHSGKLVHPQAHHQGRRHGRRTRDAIQPPAAGDC